ncbi:hypothetical protein [Halorientalis sp.]|uniref:hypothetical protein n=1 Tax=Halorientalis sp. TaxID=1931229 RepID=UPI00263258B4|nr:hypothetical protein [Halorientalis sp.]
MSDDGEEEWPDPPGAPGNPVNRDSGRLPVTAESGALALGAGVTVAVLGYAVVALVTGLEQSASLSTVLRPGALGLYPGAVVAGWVDGGSLRRSADTAFRAVFVATTLAQGALFLQADAPATFLLLGLMGVAVAYALPATLFGAAGGALRRWLEGDRGVDTDV